MSEQMTHIHVPDRREDHVAMIARLAAEHEAHDKRLAAHDAQFVDVWSSITKLRDHLPFIPTLMASLMMSVMAGTIGYLIKWVEILLRTAASQ